MRVARRGRPEPGAGIKCSMTRPSVISVSRIAPDLARRSWPRVHRLVADARGVDPGRLRCLIAAYGSGDGLAESIQRVDRLLTAGVPDHLRERIAVQSAALSEASAEPGTLYLNWLFDPDAQAGLVEEIYTHTLPIALIGVLTGAPEARVMWDREDEIAARVMAAVAAGNAGPGRFP